MKLAKAMLIGGLMTTVSASVGLAALPLLITDVAGVPTETVSGEAKSSRWSPPEPASRPMAAPTVAGNRLGGEPVTALLLAGMLRQ